MLNLTVLHFLRGLHSGWRQDEVRPAGGHPLELLEGPAARDVPKLARAQALEDTVQLAFRGHRLQVADAVDRRLLRLRGLQQAVDAPPDRNRRWGFRVEGDRIHVAYPKAQIGETAVQDLQESLPIRPDQVVETAQEDQYDPGTPGQRVQELFHGPGDQVVVAPDDIVLVDVEVGYSDRKSVV